MPEYRHPRALDSVDGHPPAQVHISRAENAEVTDGRFSTDEETVVRSIAAAFDVDVSTLRVDTDADSDGVSAETPTCVGAGGDCSREVSEPGGRCWQHTEDDS